MRPQAGKKTLPIKTQARSATILPNFVGLKFQVYNGKDYHEVNVTEEMVGHKLGEFSPYVSLRRRPFSPIAARIMRRMLTSDQIAETLHLV